MAATTTRHNTVTRLLGLSKFPDSLQGLPISGTLQRHFQLRLTSSKSNCNRLGRLKKDASSAAAPSALGILRILGLLPLATLPPTTLWNPPDAMSLIRIVRRPATLLKFLHPKILTSILLNSKVFKALNIQSFGSPCIMKQTMPKADSNLLCWLCYACTADFTVALALRLLLPVCPPNSTSQHRKANGTFCNAPLDSGGRHARKCKCQGLVDARHNDLRDWSATTWSTCTNKSVPTEQHAPQWDITKCRNETIEAHLDVATTDPSTGNALYFDLCFGRPTAPTRPLCTLAPCTQSRRQVRKWVSGIGLQMAPSGEGSK